MKLLKEIWRMAGDKRGSCWLIALSCIPLTLYNVLILSPSASWSAAMVGLNLIMFLIAATEKGE